MNIDIKIFNNGYRDSNYCVCVFISDELIINCDICDVIEIIDKQVNKDLMRVYWVFVDEAKVEKQIEEILCRTKNVE